MLPPPAPPEPSGARGRSLLWGTSWIAVYTAVSLLLRVLRGLVFPRFLAPAMYGLWSSLGIVMQYSQYADLGVQQQLGKRLPGALGRDGRKGYWDLAERGLSWTACVTAAVSISLLVASFVYDGSEAWFYRPALRLLAVAIVAQSFRLVLTALLATQQEFRAVSVSGSVTEVLSFVAGVIGVVTGGVIGLVWALLVSETVGVLYCAWHLRRLGVPRLHFRLAGVTRLIREGVLLLALGFSELLLMTVDQIYLLRFFTKQEYGVYAFGLFMVTALIGIAGVFLSAQPRILEAWARGETERSHRLVEANVSLYLLVCALLYAPFVLMVDVLVHFYIPQYAVGMALFVLMPAVAVVRGPVVLLRSYFLARDWERRLIGMQLGGLALTAAADAVIVWQRWPLPWIVVSTVCGYLLAWVLTFRPFEREAPEPAPAKYALTVATMAGAGCLFWFYAARSPSTGPVAYLAESAAACAAYLAAILAVVYATRRTWRSHLRLYAEGSSLRLPPRLRHWAAHA